MRFNQVILWDWLVSIPVWAAIIIGVLLIIGFVMLAKFPFRIKGFIEGLERNSCKNGAFETPLGYWPTLITLGATLWIAVPAAFKLFRIHNASFDPYNPNSIFWVFGFDFSNMVPYKVAFGLKECMISSDMAFYFDSFARLWFVPIVSAALSFLLRLGKFASAGAATGYLVMQFLLVNALYWGYGFLLVFIIVPVIVASAIIIVGLIAGAGSGASQNSGTRPSSAPHSYGGGGCDSSSSNSSESISGIAVEHEDMFNDGVKITPSLGPNRHLEHDSSQDSIYGNTYVDRDNGKEYIVTETDAFGHPTRVEEKWP